MTHDSRWDNKRILITGVCGTVGQELLAQLAEYPKTDILGFDNNEAELFLLTERYRNYTNVHFTIGDIRDYHQLSRKMKDIDIVLHLAALKHVVLCDQSPSDAIQTNIIGTQNLIDTAMRAGVERVIYTSTDKAVNPTNVMGASKLTGEKLMTASNAHRRKDKDTIFSSTRFGNVLGSRGSVIPLFKEQIKKGGPVTLTATQMTRFIMTLKESARLVIDSTFLAQGGEVFVTKMPAIQIADLAHIMVEELAPLNNFSPDDIEIKIIGDRIGEKMYEELVSEEEIRRTIELENYFVIKPAFTYLFSNLTYEYHNTKNHTVALPYNSAKSPQMDKEILRKYLIEHDLLH